MLNRVQYDRLLTDLSDRNGSAINWYFTFFEKDVASFLLEGRLFLLLDFTCPYWGSANISDKNQSKGMSVIMLTFSPHLRSGDRDLADKKRLLYAKEIFKR